MSEFLLEIGSEEIPARFLPAARAALLASTNTDLKTFRLSGHAVCLGTPRRTTLIIRDLPERQADYQQTLTGPAWERAFVDGQPTAAAIGFAKKHGIAPEALVKIETERGCFAGLTVQRQGKPSAELIREAVPRWLNTLPFGKNMRWETSGVRFARPVRWIIALFDGQVLDLTFAGLKAGRQTRGHRFYGQVFDVNSVDHYLSELEKQYVLLDPVARRQRIVSDSQKLAAVRGLTIDWDQALLDEVVDLLEWPMPLIGDFKPAFLELPDVVIEAPMKKHQRYFPLRDSRGRIAPNFLLVCNQPNDPQGNIVAGNQRVITARLSDAKYFWDQDRQKTLSEHGQKLTHITWQEGLGTLADLKDRVKLLALEILPWFSGQASVVSEAADLYLADLGTQMVYEFGELQGEIGAIYAKLNGKNEAVITAIRGAHRPKGSEDALPQTGEGLVLALAHRIDLIVGHLLAGHDVSGSQDPYGMRRAAIGVFRLLAASDSKINPAQLSQQMLLHYRQASYLTVKIPLDIEMRIEQFWQARLAAYLENSASSPALAKAVAAAAGGHIGGALARLAAIDAYFAQAERRELFLDTYKRFRNIAKDATAVDNLYDWQDRETASFANVLLAGQQALEQALEQATTTVLAKPQTGITNNPLAALEPVIAAANLLFENVTINTTNPNIAATRKGLLKKAQHVFDRIAVFDLYISGENT